MKLKSLIQESQNTQADELDRAIEIVKDTLKDVNNDEYYSKLKLSGSFQQNVIASLRASIIKLEKISNILKKI